MPKFDPLWTPVTDKRSRYNGTLPNKEACLVHELRQLVRSDEHVADLRESGDLDGLSRYLEELYQNEWTDRTAILGEQYPAFWDEESETFTGPVTTNAIEGGNWRLKHELRTPYARCQGALARTALVALQDSMYVFRNGGPEMSFACRVSDFSYEDVMGQSGPTGPNLVGKSVKAAA